MLRCVPSFCGILLATAFAGAAAYDKKSCKPSPHDMPNPQPEPDARAPDHFYYLIPTTAYTEDEAENKGEDAGLIILEVNRTWAPLGVDRFYALASDNYYDCAALFRVVPGFIVQWGIASSPEESSKWDTSITDDPVLESNAVGTVSFATAGPGTRTTQIFVNTADNSRLDDTGFAPFAKVIQGMDVLTGNALNKPDPVPNQQKYKTEGNAWLLSEYPDIDIIMGSSSPTTPKIRYCLNGVNGARNCVKDDPQSADKDAKNNAGDENDPAEDGITSNSTDSKSANANNNTMVDPNANDDAMMDSGDTISAATSASSVMYSVMTVSSLFLIAYLS